MNQQTNIAASTASDLVKRIARALFGEAGAGITDLITLANCVQANAGNLGSQPAELAEQHGAGRRKPLEIAAILRAMSINYAHGHVWDHLDAEVCREAADALSATCKQPVGEVQGAALCTELLVHADGLESTAAGDRETGESIEQAIEDGEGYTPDEPQDIAAGLQHDADRAEESAALLRKAAAALAARQPLGYVPDGVWEALQRIIENSALHGPASNEDAILVARYRRHLLADPPAQGLNLGEGIKNNEKKGSQP